MPTPRPNLLHNIPSEEIFADLHRAAAQHPGHHLSLAAYARLGRFSPDALRHRFRTWNTALAKAGLPIGKTRYYSTLHLFQQMEQIWKKSIRQPRCKDYQLIPRAPTYATYIARFGSWQNALQAFTTWANSRPNTKSKFQYIPRAKPPTHRTPRKPSARLRYQILHRDNFKCVQCGRSPANEAGVILHIDHILAWAAGGETVYENLQTLCERCNLGKACLPSM